MNSPLGHMYTDISQSVHDIAGEFIKFTVFQDRSPSMKTVCHKTSGWQKSKMACKSHYMLKYLKPLGNDSKQFILK